MRIGVMLFPTSVDEAVTQAKDLKERALASVWFPQVFGVDSLTTITAIGREVPDIDLGTAVVSIFPRHPHALAMQALSTQGAIGNRLILGLGLSHQGVIEGMYGLPYDKPVHYMREYLSILKPLLHGENVSFDGQYLTWHGIGPLEIDATPAPTLLLAALAPHMLELAATVADGTVTWMAGISTVANHIVPSLHKAGAKSPRVVAGLPVSVCADPDAARQLANEMYAIYNQLPAYRAVLDREGAAAGPGDVAIVGDEAAVAKDLQRLVDAGATDFFAAPFGSDVDRQRTLEVLTA